MTLTTYGKELILDLHKCDPSTFTRASIEQYFEEICEVIDMERCELYWRDGYPDDEKQTEPRLKGTSAVQFILTSNITIHTLDLMKNVYLNIFSCKDFDHVVAKQFSEEWFKGKSVNEYIIDRV